MTPKLYFATAPLLLAALAGCGSSAATSHKEVAVAPPSPTPTPRPDPSLEGTAARLLAAENVLGQGAALVRGGLDAQTQALGATARTDFAEAGVQMRLAGTMLPAGAPGAYAHPTALLWQADREFLAALRGKHVSGAKVAQAQHDLSAASALLRAQPEATVGSVQDGALAQVARAERAARRAQRASQPKPKRTVRHVTHRTPTPVPTTPVFAVAVKTPSPTPVPTHTSVPTSTPRPRPTAVRKLQPVRAPRPAATPRPTAAPARPVVASGPDSPAAVATARAVAGAATVAKAQAAHAARAVLVEQLDSTARAAANGLSHSTHLLAAFATESDPRDAAGAQESRTLALTAVSTLKARLSSNGTALAGAGLYRSSLQAYQSAADSLARAESALAGGQTSLCREYLAAARLWIKAGNKHLAAASAISR